MKISSVASWAGMSLFAIFGAVIFIMGHSIFTWEFWVLLFIISSVATFRGLSVEWRYKEMVEKKTVEKESKLNTNIYFNRMQVGVEALCKGKTKDEQIKLLKNKFADSLTQEKIAFDGWGKSLSAWRFWHNLNLLNLLVAVLLGICFGIILFT